MSASDDPKITFHSAMKFPIILAQCFGFFPVQGVFNLSHHKLKFSWCSFQALYSISTLVLIVLVITAEILMMSDGVQTAVTNMTIIVFHVEGALTSILFIKLAMQWPQIVNCWSQLEQEMTNIHYTANLKRKLKLIAIVILTAASVEHGLTRVPAVVHSLKCTATIIDGVKYFFMSANNRCAFGIKKYQLLVAVLIRLENLQTTFSWTFLDVFIILVSEALTMRMQQMRYKVESLSKSNTKATMPWRKLREQYSHLCDLCSELDQKMSYMVLISYGGNLYFILIQFYFSLEKPNDDIISTVYFWKSLTFLIMRMCLVSIYGAAVNEENLKILPTLLSTPSSTYNLEIDRFIDQVSHVTVALSGKNFFKLSRGLILKVAGTVVTYELVLIQFGSNWSKENSDNDAQVMARENASDWIC